MKRHRLAVRLSTPYIPPKRGPSTPICELSAVEASRVLLGEVNSNYQRVRLGAFGQATPTFTGALFSWGYNLSKNSSSAARPAIQDLQVLLGAAFKRNLVTGVFDEPTGEAVRLFQGRMDLVVDSPNRTIVGPSTKSALQLLFRRVQEGVPVGRFGADPIARMRAVLGPAQKPIVQPGPTQASAPPIPPPFSPGLPPKPKPLPLGWIFGGLTAAGLLVVGVVAATRRS